MLDRVEEIVKRHAALVEQQSDPDIAVDPVRSRELAKKVAEVEPVVTTYRGRQIVAMPGPSSGGIAVASALGILANFDLPSMPPSGPLRPPFHGTASTWASAHSSN